MTLRAEVEAVLSSRYVSYQRKENNLGNGVLKIPTFVFKAVLDDLVTVKGHG